MLAGQRSIIIFDLMVGIETRISLTVLALVISTAEKMGQRWYASLREGQASTNYQNQAMTSFNSGSSGEDHSKIIQGAGPGVH